jgi:hypothetical protein
LLEWALVHLAVICLTIASYTWAGAAPHRRAGKDCGHKIGAATISFLKATEAQAALGRRDAYTAALTPEDTAALGRAAPGESDVRDYAVRQGLSWRTAEIAKVQAIMCDLQMALARKSLSLEPLRQVQMIKTTGKEQGEAAYTRHRAIVLPKPMIERAAGKLRRTIAHEVFHVLSRELAMSDPKRRHLLYALLGFEPLDGRIALPREILDKQLTNPDAFESKYAVTVSYRGKEVRVFPVFVASNFEEDDVRDEQVWARGQLKLVQLERGSDYWTAALNENGTAALLDITATDYLKRVGIRSVFLIHRTGYNLHPEELLANAFSGLVTDSRPFVLVPRVIDGIAEILRAD